MATKRMTKIRLTTLRTMVVCWLFEEEGGGCYQSLVSRQAEETRARSW